MTLCKEIFLLTASILLFVTLTSDAQLTCDANDPCSAGSLVSVSGHITLSPPHSLQTPTDSLQNKSVREWRDRETSAENVGGFISKLDIYFKTLASNLETY